MRLTKQTGHAIRILVDCARAGGSLIKVGDLAVNLALTPQNAFKIVHLLSRAGFIVASRGPAGGCRLARDAGDIRIGDVVRAMEETTITVGRNGLRSHRSEASDTAVNVVFSDALAAFINVLDGHTLADLAAAHRGDAAGRGRAKGKAKAAVVVKTAVKPALKPVLKSGRPLKTRKHAGKAR